MYLSLMKILMITKKLKQVGQIMKIMKHNCIEIAENNYSIIFSVLILTNANVLPLKII